MVHTKKPLIFTAVAVVMTWATAFAALVLVERNSETNGATTVTFDSSFEDLNYNRGDEIVMTVTWRVDAGRATFHGFALRGPQFTPKGPDPARGELLEVTLLHDSNGPGTEGAVEVVFRFTELHLDRERNVEVGNAHFSLLLNVDTDGDGVLDDVAGHGVNVHVEDPSPNSGD